MGGIGIVRLSGPLCQQIAKQLLQKTLKARYAHYGAFLDRNGQVLDSGIALFFPSPNSFTGEDVLELQGHGGPYVLDSLLQHVQNLGARLARPGEFSERAFLNNKIDLSQAEAIADLIESSSAQAAQCALRSLQGEFSQLIHKLVESIIQLRIYVEAAIDFPEEEIDFLADGKIAQQLRDIITALDAVFVGAKQGAILKEGMSVVIAGKPNAGKSSLLNALSGRDSAIVTSIAGTTRDLLKEHINIDGMPLHIIDTAGIRPLGDHEKNSIEQEGIRRANEEIKKADRILLVIDASETNSNNTNILAPWLRDIWPDYHPNGHPNGHPNSKNTLPNINKITLVRNKVDLCDESIGFANTEDKPTATPILRISAKEKLGIDLLREHLKNCMGFNASTEGGFIARRRHLIALEKAKEFLLNADNQLQINRAGELVAADLQQAQNFLAQITGEFTSDELLGRIFSSFCIGK